MWTELGQPNTKIKEWATRTWEAQRVAAGTAEGRQSTTAAPMPARSFLLCFMMGQRDGPVSQYYLGGLVGVSSTGIDRRGGGGGLATPPPTESTYFNSIPEHKQIPEKHGMICGKNHETAQFFCVVAQSAGFLRGIFGLFEAFFGSKIRRAGGNVIWPPPPPPADGGGEGGVSGTPPTHCSFQFSFRTLLDRPPPSSGQNKVRSRGLVVVPPFLPMPTVKLGGGIAGKKWLAFPVI